MRYTEAPFNPINSPYSTQRPKDVKPGLQALDLEVTPLSKIWKLIDQTKRDGDAADAHVAEVIDQKITEAFAPDDGAVTLEASVPRQPHPEAPVLQIPTPQALIAIHSIARASAFQS
jgi:hypothetical protein